MIIIDIITNLYSCILFFPFLSYLFKKKRKIYYYILYGLLLDIISINYLLLNTIFLLLIYKIYPKKNKCLFGFYLLSFNMILISNLLVHNNISFINSSKYVVSLIINILFYLNTHKNYIF